MVISNTNLLKISYEIYETFKKFLTNPYDKLYQTNLKISLSQILIIAERISKILIDIEQSLKHNIIIEYDKQNNLLLEVLLNNKNSIINSEELFKDLSSYIIISLKIRDHR